jgi:raffinose/stachyose/melibiose transport system permease protein
MQRDGTQTSARVDVDMDPQPDRGRKKGGGYETTRRRQHVQFAILFLLPALIVYLAFMAYPFFSTIYLSLTDWNGVAATKNFVGLSNYGRMLGDGDVLKAFANNVVWVVLGTVVPVVIGLVLAILIWSGVRGSLFFRTIFFLPFVLPLVVVGLVWQWIYHPLYGIVNKVLDGVGLDGVSRAWLGEPGTALYAVLLAAIWATFGFVVMILLAALQNVDMSTVEAATIDGANWFQRAWHIIIPQIAPVLTMVTSITLIGGFSVFDIIFVMTGGGPGTASEVLATYTYRSAFNQNLAGYGSSLAMLITLLSFIAAVTFVYLRERQR